MGQAAHAHHGHADNSGHHGDGGGHEHIHPPIYYVKIWAILVALLVVSIMGPMLGIKVLTIITAFGIAVVKALMVCAFFMHLNVEKRYVWYLLFTMLAMVVLFFFATAADVNHYTGSNWTKPAAVEYNNNFLKAAEEREKLFLEEGVEETLAPAPAKAEGAKP